MKICTSAVLVTVMSLALGVTGCAGELEAPASDEVIGETSQALSGKELEYEYYSNDTYTVQVGFYYAPCGGLPTRTGRKTRFIIGSQTACSPPNAQVGCWQVIDGTQTCTYFSCVSCDIVL